MVIGAWVEGSNGERNEYNYDANTGECWDNDGNYKGNIYDW